MYIAVHLRCVDCCVVLVSAIQSINDYDEKFLSVGKGQSLSAIDMDASGVKTAK